MQMSPILKKCRSLSVSPTQSPPEVAIKGLSQKQLVDVLNHVLTNHPELKGRSEICNVVVLCVFICCMVYYIFGFLSILVKKSLTHIQVS